MKVFLFNIKNIFNISTTQVTRKKVNLIILSSPQAIYDTTQQGVKSNFEMYFRRLFTFIYASEFVNCNLLQNVNVNCKRVYDKLFVRVFRVSIFDTYYKRLKEDCWYCGSEMTLEAAQHAFSLPPWLQSSFKSSWYGYKSVYLAVARWNEKLLVFRWTKAWVTALYQFMKLCICIL